MKRLIGNDFQYFFNAVFEESAVNFSEVLALSVKIKHQSLNLIFTPEYEIVDGNLLIECSKDQFTYLGKYYIIVSWKIVNTSFSDGYQDIVADSDIVEIVDRLLISDGSIGARILDDATYQALSTNDKYKYRNFDDDWNVCEPTHIIFQLGTNDASNTVALANIQKFITQIRDEGFTSIWVGVAFVGAAGAINVYEYESKYDPSTLIQTYTYNDKAKLFTDSYKTLDNDSNKVNFIPTYFVQPTGDGTTMRNIYPLENLLDENNKYGVMFGNQPILHPNVNAHLAWAYQYYSWIKWTL